MRLGLRVVRGPAWRYGDQDGGEGHVGTVVEIGGQNLPTPEQCVTVSWDTGTKKVYRVGHQKAYDLLAYDNGPCGVFHPNTVCSGCEENGIEGFRWKCSECEEVNLCSSCYHSNKHSTSHPFLRFDNRSSVGVACKKRNDCSSERCRALGIFVGATVRRGPDWEWKDQDGPVKEGTVIQISNWLKSFRGQIKVSWTGGSTYSYRLGVDGKLDLSCVVPSQGDYYYKSHLPIVGQMNDEETDSSLDLSSSLSMLQVDGDDLASLLMLELLGDGLLDSVTAKSKETQYLRIGFRVVRGPDWIWGNQDKSEGHLATVVDIGGCDKVNIPDKCVAALWDCGSRDIYRAGAAGGFDLRIFDTAPCGIQHSSVSCSSCKVPRIQGMRWQCQVCAGVNLCSACYGDDQHDVDHAFWRVDNASSKQEVPRRRGSKKVQAMGIFKDATVIRGHDWRWGNQDGGVGHQGRVLSIDEWNKNSGRSKADVEWRPGAKNSYRVGHDGKMDLTCVKVAAGWFYYVDHLPLLGQVEGITSCFEVGEHVKSETELYRLKELQDGHGGISLDMISHLNKVGTVCGFDSDGDVLVKFGDSSAYHFNPEALSKV
ncbi:unnamed protein product, partial [Lymnaea stagnalis]